MKKTITILSIMIFILIFLFQGYRFYLVDKISKAEVLLDRISTTQVGQTDLDSLSEKENEETMILLTEAVRNEEHRFFQASDNAVFLKEGREITALIKNSGLTIQSYKLMPRESSVTYQYQLSCEVRQFINILEKLRNRDRFLKIVNLSINSSTRPALISLILSPVIYPESDEAGTFESTLVKEESKLPFKEYSPWKITHNMFSIPPGTATGNPIPAPAPIEAVVQELEIPIGPSWLKFIGTSSSGEKKVYYLMDERSNKTMKLSLGESLGSYTLTQVQPDRIYLQIEGDTVYVYK